MTTYLGLTEVLASLTMRTIANSSSSLKAAISHGCMTGLVSSKKKSVGHLVSSTPRSHQGAFDYVDEAFDVWRERTRNWISRGSKRKGLNARMRQRQRVTTSLLRIGFRWSLRLRLSRRRALRCPPWWSREVFLAMWGQS